MSEGKFWIIQFAILAAIIISIGYFTMSYWIDHNTKIVQLLKDGRSANDAMCALQDDYGNHPTCIILATKEIR